MIQNDAIIIDNVSKTYTSRARVTKAVDQVSLSVRKGEVLGVLGDNGAGKTTLINMISTQLTPDSGSIQVLGFDTKSEEKKIRPRINLVEGGDKGLYPWLTAYESLQLFALLYKVPKSETDALVTKLLETVELETSAWKVPVMTLSKGMKQRVLLAKALVNDPELILLDEPTLGLDLQAVKKVRALIREWAKSGKTCVVTSHNIGDIDAVCDRVAVIRSGELRGVFAIDDLRAKYRSIARMTVLSDMDTHQKALDEIGHVLAGGGANILTLSVEQSALSGFYAYVSKHHEEFADIQLENNSLEEFYIQLMDEA